MVWASPGTVDTKIIANYVYSTWAKCIFYRQSQKKPPWEAVFWQNGLARLNMRKLVRRPEC